MVTRWVLLLGLITGCGGSVLLEESETKPLTSETSETGTVPTPTTSTVTVTTPSEVLSQVSATLHPEFDSLVVVTWEQSVAGDAWVEYSVDADEWRVSPTQAVGVGSAEQLLLGVPYEHTVTYRVHVQTAAELVVSPTNSIETGTLPNGFPVVTLHEYDASLTDNGTDYVLMSIDQTNAWKTHAIIIDRQGRVVWLRSSGSGGVVMHPRLSLDGSHILLDHNSYWGGGFDNGVNSRVERLTLDGTILHDYATPGLHHPFTELPDGRIAWGSAVGSNETLEIVDDAGVQTSLWSCAPFNASVGIGGYCQSNTLSYRPDTDSFLFSMFSSETIIEIDGKTGDSLRWFGHATGSYAFDPPESAFWWQHGGYVTPTGTLLTSSKGENDANETVVREYAINASTQTLEEVWSFGAGEAVYGSEMGEAHRLENGNTLHNYGQACRLREVTSGGQIVWDVSWNSDFMGRSIGLPDLYALVSP